MEGTLASDCQHDNISTLLLHHYLLEHDNLLETFNVGICNDYVKSQCYITLGVMFILDSCIKHFTSFYLLDLC